MIIRTILRVLQDETGATAIDYGIVVLLLSITAALAFETVGDYLDSMLSSTLMD